MLSMAPANGAARALGLNSRAGIESYGVAVIPTSRGTEK